MKNGLGFVGLENRFVGLKTLKTGRIGESPTLWASAADPCCVFGGDREGPVKI
jgi:hypothetical protein